MAIKVTETIENGIPYRITEDDETGFYLKESMQEIPDPEPQPSRIAQLEAENRELKLALAELAEAHEREKTEMQLAIAELAELIAGGE
jgi:primase-polymerase (primpol)-like protein